MPVFTQYPVFYLLIINRAFIYFFYLFVYCLFFRCSILRFTFGFNMASSTTNLCALCLEPFCNSEFIECSGGCACRFHETCANFSSKKTDFTCADCLNIKPCHVFRLLRHTFAKLDTLSTTYDTLCADSIFIANKVKAIDEKFTVINDALDDIRNRDTLDKLLTTCSLFQHDLSKLVKKYSHSDAKLNTIDNNISELMSASNASSAPIGDKQYSKDLDLVRRNVASCSSMVKSISEWTSKFSLPPTPPSTTSVDCQTDLVPDHGCEGPSAALAIQVDHQLASDASVTTVDQTAIDPVRPSTVVRGKHGRRKNNNKHNKSRRHPAPLVTQPESVSDLVTGNNDGGVIDQETADLPPSSTAFRSELKPAIQPKVLFISRLLADTTDADVVLNIKRILEFHHFPFSSDAICCKKYEASAYNDRSRVSSFKVILPASCFDVVASLSFWPSGAIVKEFVHSKRHLRARSIGAPKNFKAPYQFSIAT